MSIKKDTSLTEGCVALIVAFVIILPLTLLLKGWMLTKLWAMFIVPTFGLPVLTYDMALGIALLIGAITKQDLSRLAKKEQEESLMQLTLTSLMQAIMEPLVIIGLAYIIVWLF